MSYHSEERKRRVERLFSYLTELPSFYKDSLLGINDSSMSAITKLEYSRNVKEFFQFLIKNNPLYKDYSTKDFTLADLERINANDANEYATYLNADHSPATIARKLAAISSMYKELQRYEKVSHNPFGVIRRPSIKAHNVIHLTDSEYNKFMHVVRTGEGMTKKELQNHDSDRDIAIFSLFLDTGIRISELVSLDISDLDFEEAAAYVIRKGGKADTVFYSDETRDRLLYYYENCRNSRLKPGENTKAFFLNNRGNRLSVRSIELLTKKYAMLAIPMKAEHFSPHKLRSTFAMDFYAATNDLLGLQEKMGHSNISTTNIYAKALKENSRLSRNVLQEARRKKADD